MPANNQIAKEFEQETVLLLIRSALKDFINEKNSCKIRSSLFGLNRIIYGL